MVHIQPGSPGATWLRAMFRLYCRLNQCTTIYYPDGTCEAVGEDSAKAYYDYEMANGRLLIQKINQMAKRQGERTNTILADTTRDFVKKLWEKERECLNK